MKEPRANKTRERRNNLKSKLIGYTTAAGAALTTGQVADAAIMASINQNITIFPGQTFDLDINNDGAPDMRFGLDTAGTSNVVTVPFFDVDTYFNTAGTMATVRRFSDFQYQRTASRDDSAYASKIGYGGRIAGSGALRRLSGSTNVNEQLMNYGAASAGQLGYWQSDYFVNRRNAARRFYKRIFTTGGGSLSYPHPYAMNIYSGYQTGPFMTSNGGGPFLGSRGFLGVEFQDAALDTRYAWVDVELAFDFSSLTVYGWAFQTEPGVGIHAGSVPEPSTLASLATGVAGVLALRRGRRKRAAEAKAS